MINPISSAHTSQADPAAQPALPKAPPPSKNSLPQDTVKLKSAGDADHDGDSK